MPSLVAMWTGIGATLALGYYMIGRAIRLNDQELKEKRALENRTQAQALAKPVI